MIFKASVKDDTGALQHIERDYPTKKQFIRDLRNNGFKVDNRKVLTKKSFDYIIENTNCTKWDWREYTDEQIADGVDGLTIYMSQEHKPRNRKECYEVRVNFFHEEPTVFKYKHISSVRSTLKTYESMWSVRNVEVFKNGKQLPTWAI